MYGLKNCPRCASNSLRRYHKYRDCVKCEVCGFFTTEENWNDGNEREFDSAWIRRVRYLEALKQDVERTNEMTFETTWYCDGCERKISMRELDEVQRSWIVVNTPPRKIVKLPDIGNKHLYTDREEWHFCCRSCLIKWLKVFDFDSKQLLAMAGDEDEVHTIG